MYWTCMDSPAAAQTDRAARKAQRLRVVERSGRSSVKLSIFWRLALSSLAIIIVVAGVNFYALSQLRQLTALSTELVSYHYPSIDTAKRLLANLYTQLGSEKKYLAVRDLAFVRDFAQEVDEFRQILTTLQEQESAPDGQKLLKEVDRLHQGYLDPLRRVQEHIRQIGQGTFGRSVNVEAPSDLRELVDTVNWMGKKLQELDDMKAEFLAHVSHELRTPLASIREGTQLLLDEIPGPLSKEQRETLRIIKDSSERLIRLISTLLDLSKMAAGMMDYQIAPTDLLRLAETSVDKVRLLAEGKRIQILTEAPSGRVWVPADGARIEQVLDNLLSNALKFSQEGATVNIRLHLDVKAGVAHVAVADTGPGIPPEDLPHIWERFYQGRSYTKNTMAGSGLGLALAKKVVEAHWGRIWVESDLGKGTTVHFTLPLARKGGPA